MNNESKLKILVETRKRLKKLTENQKDNINKVYDNYHHLSDESKSIADSHLTLFDIISEIITELDKDVKSEIKKNTKDNIIFIND